MDLGLLAGLGQGVTEGINNYVNLSGTLQQRKTAQEDALAKRKQAVIDDAFKRAQITDLLGEDGAAKLLGGGVPDQAQEEQPAWKQLLASNDKTPSGLIQTPGQQGQPSGLMPAMPQGLLPRRQREAYNKNIEAYVSKHPEGNASQLNPKTGLLEMVKRPLTDDEKRGIEKENLGIEIQKRTLDKEKEESQNVKPDQSQAALYGKRMLMADDVINKQAAEGFNRSSMETSLQSYAPNMFKGPQLQKQEQAERDFVNAILRKESGSAISKDEFSSAEKQYFPRNGDTPEVIAQKAQNRALAIDGMKLASGPKAWKKLGVPAVAPTKKQVSPEDAQALEWANANPKDPRAAAIKKRLGK